MTTSVSELRNITLKARGENSNGRLEQYTKARDEAFDLMTDGVMDRIKDAASNGKFRYPIYRWVNTPRFQKDSVEDSKEQSKEQPENPEDDTKVFFGNSDEGRNGLHIMSLINPKGIDPQHSLITKLREFFNSSVEDSTDDERRENQLKVYFENHPLNFRKCAIFVSWDRKQVQRSSYGGGVRAGEPIERKRFPVSSGNVSEHFASLAGSASDDAPATDKKRFVSRGFPDRKFVPRGGYVKRA
jgi:hypothetical protein